MWFMSLGMVLTQGSFGYPCLSDPALLLLVESQENARQQGEEAQRHRRWLQWVPNLRGGPPGWHVKRKPPSESLLFPLRFSRTDKSLRN